MPHTGATGAAQATDTTDANAMASIGKRGVWLGSPGYFLSRYPKEDGVEREEKSSKPYYYATVWML